MEFWAINKDTTNYTVSPEVDEDLLFPSVLQTKHLFLLHCQLYSPLLVDLEPDQAVWIVD